MGIEPKTAWKWRKEHDNDECPSFSIMSRQKMKTKRSLIAVLSTFFLLLDCANASQNSNWDAGGYTASNSNRGAASSDYYQHQDAYASQSSSRYYGETDEDDDPPQQPTSSNKQAFEEGEEDLERERYSGSEFGSYTDGGGGYQSGRWPPGEDTAVADDDSFREDGGGQRTYTQNSQASSYYSERRPPPPPLPPAAASSDRSSYGASLSQTQEQQEPAWGAAPDAGGRGSSSDGAASATSYNPIHYNFESRAEKEKKSEPTSKSSTSSADDDGKKSSSSGGGIWRLGRRRGASSDEPSNEKEKQSGDSAGDGDTGLAEKELDQEAVPETFIPGYEREEGNTDPTDDRATTRDGRRAGGAAATVPRYASPRNDAVTRYMTTSKTHRMILWFSAGTVGAVFGTAIGKSLLNGPYFMATVGAAAFLICFVLRNPYGELVRALGLTLVWAVERSRSVRRSYPTWRHVKSSIGAGPRIPFPPRTNNPWNYQPDEDDRSAVEFSMLYSLIAMAFVGSACGGNMPLIPSWLGALAGAAVMAYATTLRSARGDLARSMGMRVVATGRQVLQINQELQLLRKTAVVSGLILDKVLILDRKHRIKDRIISGATFLYEQATRTASQMQQQRGGDDNANRRRRRGGPPPDDDDEDRRRRPYGRDEEGRRREDDSDGRGGRDYRRERSGDERRRRPREGEEYERRDRIGRPGSRDDYERRDHDGPGGEDRRRRPPRRDDDDEDRFNDRRAARDEDESYSRSERRRYRDDGGDADKTGSEEPEERRSSRWRFGR